jgi:hypothetical protein
MVEPWIELNSGFFFSLISCSRVMNNMVSKIYSVGCAGPLRSGWIIPVLLLTVCCRQQVKKAQADVQKTSPKHAIIKKPPSSFNDTLVIKQKSAVFYSPDSLQMKKIEAVNEKNMMDQIRHDCHYQMQYARSSLRSDWPKVKIIEASDKRFLLFIKQDGRKIYIDLNNKNDICGIFLFDGKKDPVLVDMPNVDTILGDYFR